MKGKNKSNKNLTKDDSCKKSSNKKKQNSEKKKKKVTIKNTLANPFTLDWPSLNYKDYIDIKRLLQNSLSEISEDYATYLNEKKLKRKEFYAAKMKKKESDKVCILKTPETNTFTANEMIGSKGLSIGHESLVFGYNAVMRGLEKGSVISVLVYSKAKPDLIVKMFIPICSVKSIPVIPVDNLKGIVKDTGIGINSCLALGLKKSVILKENLFNKLYIKTCEALGFNVCPSNELEANDQLAMESLDISHKPIGDDADDDKPVKLSAKQINSFHLYRNNVKDRIFKPNKLEGEDASSSSNFLNFDSEFIKFGEISELEENKKEDKVKGSKKWQKSKSTTTLNLDASKLSSTSMFTVDATGDSLDRNEIKNYQPETRNVILSNINSGVEGEITKESLAAGSSTYDDNNSLKNESKVPCTGDNDLTEKLNSSSSTCNKRQEIVHNTNDSSNSSKVPNSALTRPLMTNKKKRPFEEFSYVPTKVKRVKSNHNRKNTK